MTLTMPLDQIEDFKTTLELTLKCSVTGSIASEEYPCESQEETSKGPKRSFFDFSSLWEPEIGTMKKQIYTFFSLMLLNLSM